MNRKEDKLEQAVRSMEEGKQLSDEELSLLAGDKELIRACRELQSCKNALMRRYDSNFDVERNGRRSVRKHVGFDLQLHAPPPSQTSRPPALYPKEKIVPLVGHACCKHGRIFSHPPSLHMAIRLLIIDMGLSLSAIDSVQQGCCKLVRENGFLWHGKHTRRC